MSRATHQQNIGEESRRLKEHQIQAEDERGWAGQHGQRPANEEEKNYRPEASGQKPEIKK